MKRHVGQELADTLGLGKRWISFAQNGEDVRLRRIFGDRPHGCYVDVGACDPVELSITKHFYDLGWTGINFEPSPQSYTKLVEGRPLDINLNLGVGDRTGELTFFQGHDAASALSTMVAAEAEQHERRGFSFERLMVPVVTLAAALAEHLGAGRSIDFMSIDVEGYEREVIQGNDWNRFRPRVVIIEAVRPLSTQPSHDRWEQLVLDAGYLFVTFDGLNRYYVRREDEDLGPRLAISPNVFDRYIPWVYQKQIDALEEQIAAYSARHHASPVT